MRTHPPPVYIGLFLWLVLDAAIGAQVRVSTSGQGVLVQGPRIAAAPGQLAVDAIALESIDVGPPVKGAPFSARAMTEIVQTLADGNRIVRRTSGSLYRDSRGRTRREVSLEGIAGIMLSGTPLHVITISDPESRLTYVLDSDKQMRVLRGAPVQASAATPALRRLPAGGGEAPLAQPSYAERKEALGTREIDGIPCEGARATVTIPAGAIGNERAIESVTERWFSPSLGVVILSRRSDPRFGETTYHLTDIIRAEPPASLFEIPTP